MLVEGDSDKNAVEAVADTHGIDLVSTGVNVIAMHGATNIAKHLRQHEDLARRGRLAGLCDWAEAPIFRRAFADVGLNDDLEGHGFFRCRKDLEDELIRALGPGRVVALIRDAGEAERFARFQRQPQQRERPLAHQVHRFSGVKSGRKARYGGMLAAALSEESTPEPLRRLIERVREWVE